MYCTGWDAGCSPQPSRPYRVGRYNNFCSTWTENGTKRGREDGCVVFTVYAALQLKLIVFVVRHFKFLYWQTFCLSNTLRYCVGIAANIMTLFHHLVGPTLQLFFSTNTEPLHRESVLCYVYIEPVSDHLLFRHSNY